MQNRIAIGSKIRRGVLPGVEGAESLGAETVQHLRVVPDRDARNRARRRVRHKMKNLTAVRIVQRSFPNCVFAGNMPENRAFPEGAAFAVDLEIESSAGQNFNAFGVRRDYDGNDFPVIRRGKA